MACEDFTELYNLEPGEDFYKYKIRDVFCEEVDNDFIIKLFLVPAPSRKFINVSFEDFLYHSEFALVKYLKLSEDETVAFGFDLSETRFETAEHEVIVTLYGNILDIIQT